MITHNSLSRTMEVQKPWIVLRKTTQELCIHNYLLRPQWFIILIFTLFAGESSVLAQDFLASFGPAGKQNLKVTAKQSGDVLTKAIGDDSGDNRTADQIDLAAFLPLFQSGDTSFGVTGKYQQLHFGNLKQNSNFVPVADLYEYKAGFSLTLDDENKDTWTLGTTYGSASDKVFEGSDVQVVDATLSKKHDSSATTSWIYFLNYSNNRSILSNIPLPGFAYVFSDEAKTSGGTLGLPFFSYWWRPSPKVFTSLFFLIPSMMRGQASLMLWGPLQGIVKLEYGAQTYLRSGRANRSEQIFYETQKAATAIKAFLGSGSFFEAEFARVFNRSLYDRLRTFELASERMSLPDEWRASLTFQIVY